MSWQDKKCRDCAKSAIEECHHCGGELLICTNDGHIAKYGEACADWEESLEVG